MIQDTIATYEEAMAKEMTVLERIKRLDDERAKLAEGAVAEALEEAQRAVEQLNLLGRSYELVDTSKPVRKGKTQGQRSVDPDKVCEICGFATLPRNHDKRAHRGQGSDKKAFTDQELRDRGMSKA